ncbi:hypothetical protein N9Y60_04060 [Crocinitomicaceae bacterium]|nr:hypothetical protein [Crocinitomicaceae bacterium]MDC0257161.1 hypothetical protein [Crocinitomicaceae bacterium]
MKKASFLALILISITLVSCKSMKEGKDGTKSLDIELIQSGDLMGDGSEGIEESIVVCNSQEELDAICKKMNSVNHVTSALDDLVASDVDFGKQSIVAYFQPVRSTGEYSLTAESLMQIQADGAKSYILHVSLSSPQGAAITVLTQPYIFLITDKMEGPIKYKVTEASAL